MSCIVYQTDKRTGIKYAYESISYWDKEKKQPRSKRKYIGRVDPETGEIIQKKEDSHSVGNDEHISDDTVLLTETIREKDHIISELRNEIRDRELAYSELLEATKNAIKLLAAASDVLPEART